MPKKSYLYSPSRALGGRMANTQSIKRLKSEVGAIILAHNYQRPEVQDVADFVGDSLELSLKAAESDAEYIVFCGVDFMAEQAAILNPKSVVLHPVASSICPMAHMLSLETAKEYRERYPGAPFVVYVNSIAEVKAVADYIVTSANAAKLVGLLKEDTVLFGPDRHLASYVAEKTGKKIIPVPAFGHCPVHVLFDPEHVQRAREAFPGSRVLAHPECVDEVRRLSDFVGSTSQMLRAPSSMADRSFVIGTEVGVVHRMRSLYPDRNFVPLSESAVCPNMKKITLDSVETSLRARVYRVNVPEHVAAKVRENLKRTFDLLGVNVSWRWN